MHEKKTILKIICASCRKDMGEKDGEGAEGVTGTFCKECWDRQFPGIPYPEEETPSRTPGPDRPRGDGDA